MNILDGGTSATSTTVVGADRVILNDDGTMKQVAVTDLATYFDNNISVSGDITVDKITLNNGNNREISIQQASSTNEGDELTIKAGKGADGDDNVTDPLNAENSNGKDGGDINITAGDGGDVGSFTGSTPYNSSAGVRGDVNITGTNIELNGTVTTASTDLVLQAASGKNVNITAASGNSINLNGILKATTITTSSTNLTLGAASGSKIQIDEPITTANGKHLVLGAATGKQIKIDNSVVSTDGNNLVLGAATGKTIRLNDPVSFKHRFLETVSSSDYKLELEASDSAGKTISNAYIWHDTGSVGNNENRIIELPSPSDMANLFGVGHTVSFIVDTGNAGAVSYIDKNGGYNGSGGTGTLFRGRVTNKDGGGSAGFEDTHTDRLVLNSGYITRFNIRIMTSSTMVVYWDNNLSVNSTITQP